LNEERKVVEENDKKRLRSAVQSGLMELHQASERGDVTLVRTLLVDRADPNGKDGHGMTALHMAAGAAHANIVGLLLSWGAKPDITNAGGFTPAQLTDRQDIRDMLQRPKCDNW
jgi:ankyrin repeat protein